MTAPREDKVRMLAEAANRGMAEAIEGCTAQEVFSAYLTLAATIIQVMVEMNVPSRAIRHSIEQLLVRCPVEGKVN